MEKISVIVGGCREKMSNSSVGAQSNSKLEETEEVMAGFDAQNSNPSSLTSSTSLSSKKRGNAVYQNNLLQVPIKPDHNPMKKVIKSELLEKGIECLCTKQSALNLKKNVLILVVPHVTDAQMKKILHIVKQPEFQRVQKTPVQQKDSDTTESNTQTLAVARSKSSTRSHLPRCGKRKSSSPINLPKSYRDPDKQTRHSATKEKWRHRSSQKREGHSRREKVETRTRTHRSPGAQRHKTLERSSDRKARSETRSKSSKSSSTSGNDGDSHHKRAKKEVKTSSINRKRYLSETKCDKEKAKQKNTSAKQEKVDKKILPDSTTSPASNIAPRPASPPKDKLDNLVNVLQAVLKQVTSSNTEKENKDIMTQSSDKTGSTTFHVNFDVSSPKVKPSHALKLPGNIQRTFSNLSELDECFSPTSSYSPCSDTEQELVEDSDGAKEEASNLPNITNLSNPNQKGSESCQTSSMQAKDHKVMTKSPAIREMSFWPSSLIRIDCIESNTVDKVLKAPVCQKCIYDNAHLDGIHDPRSQNQKYIRYFILWRMCCLCLETKGANENFRMCSLPESKLDPKTSVLKLTNEEEREGASSKQDGTHTEMLQADNVPQQESQSKFSLKKDRPGVQTNMCKTVGPKTLDVISPLSCSESLPTNTCKPVVPNNSSESPNHNLFASDRTFTSLPLISDNMHTTGVPSTTNEQDTPYYYNINYFNEVTKNSDVSQNNKTCTSEYQSATEEETVIPPEPNTPTRSDEPLHKTKQQDSPLLISAVVPQEVNNVTQIQEAGQPEPIPPHTNDYQLGHDAKLFQSNEPSENCLLTSKHHGVEDKGLNNLFQSCISSKTSGPSETGAESSDDPVSSLFGHFQVKAAALLNQAESSPGNTWNNDSSGSGEQTMSVKANHSFSQIVYSDLSSESDEETTVLKKSESTGISTAVEMSPTNTSLKLKPLLSSASISSSDFSSPKKLINVEKQYLELNSTQTSPLMEHPATCTVKNLYSETSDIFDSTENEGTDCQPMHSESSHDWSNPEWLDVEIPQLNRSKRRRTTIKSNSTILKTTNGSRPSVVRSQSTYESSEKNLPTDRNVPFKKRRFSDLPVAKSSQETITDLNQSEKAATKNPSDSFAPRLDVCKKGDDESNKSSANQNSDLDSIGSADYQLSDSNYEPDIDSETDQPIQNTNDDNIFFNDDSNRTEHTENFTHTQPSIECNNFYVKGKSYAWPYTYPTLSQIDALSDSDDSEEYAGTHFCKPFVFLKRLEEDGYLPKCFVEDMADHQCCLCCTNFCCSTPWVSIEKIQLVE